MMLIPYSFTGVTAELFSAAHRSGLALRSTGPARDKVWWLLAGDPGVWFCVPRDAMPLLLGVLSLDEAHDAVALVDGVPTLLTGAELDDAVTLLARAGAQGGGRCR